MKAKVHRFHSPDCDLDTFVPGDAEDVGILVQIIAGPFDGPGEESFDVLVLTPRWLSRWIEERGPLVGRHHLFVNHFDWAVVRTILVEAVERESAASWTELGDRISRLARWEFEDYRDDEPS